MKKFVAVIFFLCIATPLLANEVEQAREYAACMKLTQSEPEEAFESALAWRDRGGGDPAKHCIAAALIGLKFHKEGAERLETLAQEMKAEPAFRARVFDQAGQAWLTAGQAQRARDVLTAGLRLNGNSVTLLMSRAQAFAADKLYYDAIDDLNRVLELNPEWADAYVFRAAAYRFAESLELAEQDVDEALRREPDHVEGLLEKGIIERLLNRKEGARQAWMRLLELAPDSPAADAARANLEKMDVDKSK